MQIVIASDSFKGSLSAMAATEAIGRGVKKIFPEVELIKMPVADGGEGTVQALVLTTNGKLFKKRVIGPLGDEVEATWGVLGDGQTAVIEMAEASGLLLIPTEKRNPRMTTTYGTGQLIQAALDKGVRKIIIGIGGSATNDGGVGMAQALGVRFLDDKLRELPFGGEALINLVSIDLTGLDSRLSETEIVIACDVNNPLCGLNGASIVYAPQKGASPEEIEKLDKALTKYAMVAQSTTGKNFADIPGAGAAGGLGAGLLWFTGARMTKGINLILEIMQFEDAVKQSDLVITGEGCTDYQTVYGKTPVGIAEIAMRYNIPVICLSGALGQGYEQIFQHGIAAAESIVPRPMNLEICMDQVEKLLEESAERICRLIRIGKLM